MGLNAEIARARSVSTCASGTKNIMKARIKSPGNNMCEREGVRRMRAGSQVLTVFATKHVLLQLTYIGGETGGLEGKFRLINSTNTTSPQSRGARRVHRVFFRFLRLFRQRHIHRAPPFLKNQNRAGLVRQV